MGSSRDNALPPSFTVEPSERPLRIAVVYSRLPFPMMRGDQLTIAHLLGFLGQRGHAVDLWTLDVDGEVSPEQHEWLVRQCRNLSIRPQSRSARLIGALFGLLKARPLQAGVFDNRELTRELDETVRRGDYDIVYVYYLRAAWALKQRFEPGRTRRFGTKRTAAFLALQLSQTLNTRRIVDNRRTGPLKWLYWLEWRLLRRAEAQIWTRFTKVMLIGPKDVAAIEQACRDEGKPLPCNWLYGAHGTDVRRFRIATPEERVAQRVVFSGSMLYEPNIQAALWFIERCWERVRHRFADAELFIVGRDPSRELRALNGVSGITVTGTVPDVGDYIRSASVCINPVLAAGGMQNKLIEYLACGVPVVTTSVANEGIMAPDGQTLLVRDAPTDFADAVCELLEDRRRARELGEAGRRFVEDHWTWEAHFLSLEAHFHDALETNDETVAA